MLILFEKRRVENKEVNDLQMHEQCTLDTMHGTVVILQSYLIPNDSLGLFPK